MAKAKARKGEKTRTVAYRLPPDLIKGLKREAIERDKYPAQLLAEILRERLPQASKAG